jgi:hypothetical protein
VLSLTYLRTKSDDLFSNDASFSHPRVFEGPNLWERAIKGYVDNESSVICLIKNVWSRCVTHASPEDTTGPEVVGHYGS